MITTRATQVLEVDEASDSEQYAGLIPLFLTNQEAADEVANLFHEAKHKQAILDSLPSAARVIGDEIEQLSQRLISFTPRGKTWQAWEEVASNLFTELEFHFGPHGVFNGGVLTCPICKSRANVVLDGCNRAGIQTYLCKNIHSPEYLSNGNTSGHRKFSLPSSWEAREFICDKMKEIARLLIFTNCSIEAASQVQQVSSYFVEMVQGMIAQSVLEGGLQQEAVNLQKAVFSWGEKTLVPVFTDFSGTAVSKKMGMLLTTIGDQAIFEIDHGNHALTFTKMLKDLQHRLPVDVTPVFISDGEITFIQPIRDFFPDTIHIRQFHSKPSLGIIQIHFPHQGELYTMECRWDIVLPDGEACERTRQQRLRRNLKKAEAAAKAEVNRRSASEKVRWHEPPRYDPTPDDDSWRLFPDDVYLFKGMKTRAARRRRRPPCNCNQDGTPLPGIDDQEEAKDGPRKGEAIPSGGEPTENHRPGCPRRVKKKRRSRKKKERVSEPAEKLWQGSKEEAKRHPIVGPILQLLILLFGGCYITSNHVENRFNVKQWLKSSRAMKAGENTLVSRIWAYFCGCKMDSDELQRQLDSVFTPEALSTFLLPRKRKPTTPSSSTVRQSWLAALKSEISLEPGDRQGVVIEYRNYHGYYSHRAILPEKLIQRDPTGDWEIHGYCCKRKAPRMFLLSRVQDLVRVAEASQLVVDLGM